MKYFYVLILLVSALGYSQLSPLSQDGNATAANDKVSIYPNPVTENHFFVSTNKNLTIRIFDVLGKLVAVREISAAENKVDVSDLQKGIYLVNIKSENYSATRKLIIQ